MLTLQAGRWKLEVGSWEREARGWKLDLAGAWIPEGGSCPLKFPLKSALGVILGRHWVAHLQAIPGNHPTASQAWKSHPAVLLPHLSVPAIMDSKCLH